MARTTLEAHKRIDAIEPRTTKLETEVHRKRHQKRCRISLNL